jgi:hypothetical protein
MLRNEKMPKTEVEIHYKNGKTEIYDADRIEWCGSTCKIYTESGAIMSIADGLFSDMVITTVINTGPQNQKVSTEEKVVEQPAKEKKKNDFIDALIGFADHNLITTLDMMYRPEPKLLNNFKLIPEQIISLDVYTSSNQELTRDVYDYLDAMKDRHEFLCIDSGRIKLKINDLDCTFNVRSSPEATYTITVKGVLM